MNIITQKFVPEAGWEGLDGPCLTPGLLGKWIALANCMLQMSKGLERPNDCSATTSEVTASTQRGKFLGFASTDPLCTCGIFRYYMINFPMTYRVPAL